MLNRAARFFPILRELADHLPDGGTILEVGSGSIGLGEFLRGPFVGCDISFSTRPVENMRAVCCSGDQLPFREKSFDAVVVSDVMEHIPPERRSKVVSEVLRVTRKVLIIGYPCGPAAFELDQQLYREYQRRNSIPPVWLQEHMGYPFPDEKLLAELPGEWMKKVIPNEGLGFHSWAMRAEMSRLWSFYFRWMLRISPRFVERVLEFTDRDPSYRKIFVLTRETPCCYDRECIV